MTDVAEELAEVAPAIGRIGDVVECAPVRPQVATREPIGARSQTLRAILIGLDGVTAWLTWLVVLTVGLELAPLDVTIVIATVTALVTCGFAWSQRLYQARVAAVRSHEIVRVFRVAPVKLSSLVNICRF